MKTETLLQSMLHDLWGDLREPSVVWQIIVLLACLAVAWWASRGLLRRWRDEHQAELEGAPADDSRSRWLGSLQARQAIARLLYPLYALVLLLIARPILGIWHSTHLLKLAAVMMVAAVLVRTIVYVISTLSRSPVLAAFERVLVALVWGSLVLHVTGYAHDLIQLLESIQFPVGTQTLNLWTMLSSVFWIVLTILMALWLGGMVEAKVLSTQSIDSSLRAVLSRLVRSLFLVVAVLMGFSIVGIDLTALSVFGGALGVGLGLGLQRIASNYISGFIVLLERQVQLGDMVRIDSLQGTVRAIRTRFTLIEAGNGVMHILPNESLTSSTVQNFSRPGRIRLNLPIQVAYDTDLDQAIRLAIEAARATARVLPTPEPAVILTKFDADGINLEVSFTIGDPEKGQNQAISAVARSVWSSFQAAGIQVPFPQREIRVVSDVTNELGQAADPDESKGAMSLKKHTESPNSG